MRLSHTRLLAFLVAAVVLLLPACSKSQPPAPAPRQQAAAPAPAEPEPVAEAPPAGEWEADPVDPGSSFLSPDEINARRLLRTVYFDYDRSEIRADQRATLQANAAFLRDNPTVRILVEGHADERGTREYNLALGDRRAQAARDYLMSLGIDAGRIETISYGEEQPVSTGEGESVWSLNRRAEFVAVASGPGN